MDLVNLPPWAQTVLTVLGILSLVLPVVGRAVASHWPDLGARLMAAGNDLGAALGRRPPEPAAFDDVTPVGPRQPPVDR